jgi:hypothetical protein
MKEKKKHLHELSDLGLSGKELVNLDTEKDGVVSGLKKPWNSLITSK